MASGTEGKAISTQKQSQMVKKINITIQIQKLNKTIAIPQMVRKSRDIQQQITDNAYENESYGLLMDAGIERKLQIRLQKTIKLKEMMNKLI